MVKDKNLEHRALLLAAKSKVTHCVIYPNRSTELAFITRGEAIESCPSDVWGSAEIYEVTPDGDEHRIQ